jgi:hypothetical protein
LLADDDARLREPAAALRDRYVNMLCRPTYGI